MVATARKSDVSSTWSWVWNVFYFAQQGGNCCFEGADIFGHRTKALVFFATFLVVEENTESEDQAGGSGE